jgi:hypothetical protein
MKKVIAATFLGFCLFGAVGAVFANYFDNKQETKMANQMQKKSDTCEMKDQQTGPLKNPVSEPSHCVDVKQENIID